MWLHILEDRFGIAWSVVSVSELFEYFDETAVLFLHFLMVTSALFCLAWIHEFFHRLEDFVHPPHVLVDKMSGVHFEEPVISFVLLKVPMPFLSSLTQSLSAFSSLLYFFFRFFLTHEIHRFVFRWFTSGIGEKMGLVVHKTLREELIIRRFSLWLLPE